MLFSKADQGDALLRLPPTPARHPISARARRQIDAPALARRRKAAPRHPARGSAHRRGALSPTSIAAASTKRERWSRRSPSSSASRRGYDLVRYFLATLDVPGARAECGAYRGATALLLCHVMRSVRAAYDGRRLLSPRQLLRNERVDGSRPDSGARCRRLRAQVFVFPAGKDRRHRRPGSRVFRRLSGRENLRRLDTRGVRSASRDAVGFCAPRSHALRAHARGASLLPSAAREGGVIICDGSVFCPGVQQAVDEFSSAHDAPYVWLGYRESVFVKA